LHEFPVLFANPVSKRASIAKSFGQRLVEIFAELQAVIATSLEALSLAIDFVAIQVVLVRPVSVVRDYAQLAA
jgi:hypothetical protein